MNKEQAIKYIEDRDEGLDFTIHAQDHTCCWLCYRTGREFTEIKLKRKHHILLCGQCKVEVEGGIIMGKIDLGKMSEEELRAGITEIRKDRRGVGKKRVRAARTKRVKKAEESMTQEERLAKKGVVVEEI